MSKAKARRVDYYPDEYITGVGGVLTAEQQGVYWMICSLIMSEGGAIEQNDRRLAGLCRTRPADIRRVVEILISKGKVTRQDNGKLWQKRSQSEVEMSLNRIQTAAKNGANGGRPPKIMEQNQHDGKPDGSFQNKLTTNYQPPTEEKEEPNGSSKKRGSRISPDWKLSAEWSEWAVSNGLSASDADREAQKFHDWYISAAGARGVRADWQATWRNWVRKAVHDRSGNRKGIQRDGAGDLSHSAMFARG
ncbi:DUF1376 domain-containing protein [Mesorhizobium sp.]|uniref:DUF1376 domain-containing protein n=1 Tax=Mesorhizobium sp. TaxID=1871066 RepID=UPI00257C6B1C|nr:DUF1376 domain-containing protein [Mesorhizobium sp.]